MSDLVFGPALDSARGFVLRQAGLDPRSFDAVGARGARLALIDGAVDASHPALRGTRIEPVAGSCPAMPAGAAAEHATFCASILVGADDGHRARQTLGLCRGGTLVNCVAVDAPMLAGSTPLPAVAAALAAAVRQALRAGCRTIVFGVEIRLSTSAAWRCLRDAIATARAGGAIVVLPAGNRPRTWRDESCAWPEALVVASLAPQGRPSVFSSAACFGTGTVFAPGEDIPGAAAGGAIAVRSGTSFAAALAAGVLAFANAWEGTQDASKLLPRLFPPPRRRLDASTLLAPSSTLPAFRETNDAALTIA